MYLSNKRKLFKAKKLHRLINSFFFHDSTKILNSQSFTVFRFCSRANSFTAYGVMFPCDLTPAAFRCSALPDWALDECRADTKRFYHYTVLQFYESMQFLSFKFMFTA